MSLRARFTELQALLAEHEALWRPPPFHVRRPAWRERWPALAATVDALNEATLDALHADPIATRAWLAPHLPALAEAGALSAFSPLPARVLPHCGRHFDCGVPGRKRAQIEAFAAHVPAARAPLLEWCAGKGHLGRRLALADDVVVSSLEIDARLCEAAGTLAARAGARQNVVCADARHDAAHDHIPGREVVALHACGELHRTLVRGAGRDGALGYRIAPCCYHLGDDAGYRSLSDDATLKLDADTLRLAVTETVTASRHDRRRLARDQAWKLGYNALRDAVEGEAIRLFRPVPPAWLTGDFAAFGAALAAREGFRQPANIDWAHWQAVGEQRRTEVRRHELVRHAFRRPLEAWLVLDLALGLEEAGFDVRVGTFCERALTPRNLLVLAQARR